MKRLFKNIKTLIQVREVHPDLVMGKDMGILPTIDLAYLLVEDDRITAFGSMNQLKDPSVDEVIDVTGRMVLPCWCDSHTHLVYAGDRIGEFVDRINGLSYEAIAKKGGGILNSAKSLQQTEAADLYEQSRQRLETLIGLGTGAIEIKSGYGLTPEAELKMLRVIKRLNENYPIEIKATFLPAHALPQAFKKDKSGYLDLMLSQVLPIVAKEGLATFIDVFCETGYFSVEDTDRILKIAQQFGLIPKIHVNQFTAIGGIQKALEYQAKTVDHLEVLSKNDLEALQNSATIPVALPGCSFFLGIPYTPAREIINKGIGLALASDFNPGSAPSGNMNFVLSLACIKMNMTPEEAINAATINGAYAMGVEKEVGSITVGKRANFIITKPIPSYAALPYSFGANLIDQVYLEGEEWIADKK